jgi:hypothetical protein
MTRMMRQPRSKNAFHPMSTKNQMGRNQCPRTSSKICCRTRSRPTVMMNSKTKAMTRAKSRTAATKILAKWPIKGTKKTRMTGSRTFRKIKTRSTSFSQTRTVSTKMAVKRTLRIICKCSRMLKLMIILSSLLGMLNHKAKEPSKSIKKRNSKRKSCCTITNW